VLCEPFYYYEVKMEMKSLILDSLIFLKKLSLLDINK